MSKILGIILVIVILLLGVSLMLEIDKVSKEPPFKSTLILNDEGLLLKDKKRVIEYLSITNVPDSKITTTIDKDTNVKNG